MGDFVVAHRINPRVDEHMKGRARKLRLDSTMPERLLWSRLRDRRLDGLKFRRQVPVDKYVVDYLCEEAKLIVELNGMSHDGRGQEDAKREAFLKARGLRVIRVMNDDVLKHLDEVCEFIHRAAKKDM